MNVKYYKVQVVSKNLNMPMHGFTILTTRSFTDGGAYYE